MDFGNLQNKGCLVENILKEEERITNLICDSIQPMLIPDVDIVNHMGKELLLLRIPHLAGPYHLKTTSVAQSAYIRLGSSNRLADPETLANLQRFAKRITFDKMPCIEASIDDLNKKLISEKLNQSFKNISSKSFESLGLVVSQANKKHPTYSGLLLFCDDRSVYLPDSIVKCVSFASTEKKNIIDKREIDTNLIDAVDEVIIFIQRNMRVAAEIGPIRRKDIPEYPITAIRESVINAITDADYSIKGSSIQISIFSNRIEIINPGRLPLGQTMDSALAGVSKMRNPIIGRIFREIGIIETLGMGILNIKLAYENTSVESPVFEEIDLFFKVALYSRGLKPFLNEPWAIQLQELLQLQKEASASEIAAVWGVTVRTARTRLNKLIELNYIKRNATSTNDPNTTYSVT